MAESLSPFVAARLVAPLVPFLPALAHAAARLAHPDVLQRPPSFACLERWLSLPPRGDSRAGGGGSGSGGASAAAPPDGPPASSPSLAWLVDPDARAWRSLDEACDPKVHNEGLTSRWVEGAGGKA